MAFTKKIYEQVRELIEADVLEKAPGEPIDTEVGYAKRFGVSRPTVRKAVEDLIAVGLLRRAAGKGLIPVSMDEVPNRGKLLIVLPHSVGDGFYYKVIMGCVEEANHLGFEYKLINTDDEALRLQTVKKERLSEYTAAITCCYGAPEELSVVDHIREAGTPLMLVDNPMSDSDLPCIMCDDFNGGYLIGQYLIKKGHSKIVNISGVRPAQTIQKRDAGFLTAFRDADLCYDMDLLIRTPDSVESFAERFTAQDIIGGRITAICSYSSLNIVRISKWLYENRLKIYEDISLVGYGDHPFLPNYGMPITSIEVPSEEMGRSAVNEISQSLLGHRPMQDVRLDVWLEKRHTVRSL